MRGKFQELACCVMGTGMSSSDIRANTSLLLFFGIIVDFPSQPLRTNRQFSLAGVKAATVGIYKIVLLSFLKKNNFSQIYIFLLRVF